MFRGLGFWAMLSEKNAMESMVYRNITIHPNKTSQEKLERSGAFRELTELLPQPLENDLNEGNLCEQV
jgi:hypothetical protein